MNETRSGIAGWGPLALAVSCVIAPPVIAQTHDYELGLELGVGSSDNIGSAPDTLLDPALDETAYIAGLDFLFVQDSRRWNADFRGKVQNYSYVNNVFEDQTLSTVNGRASLDLVERRVNWDFTVNHGQQLLNPFQPVNPGNLEDITVLSTGPGFNFPIGRRTYLTAGATYSDIDYELRPLDNERLSGRIGLLRAISPEKSVSLNIDADRIEYDLSFLNAPIDRQNAYLGYNVDDVRNTTEVKVGWNRIESDGKEGDGLLLEVNWSREISALSTMTVNLGSNYSTDGDIFRLNQFLDNDRSGTQDVQSVSDPFRHDYIRLGYTYLTPRTRFNATVRFDKEAYETQTAFDRDYGGVDLSIRREFSPKLNFSVFGHFISRDYGTLTRTDDNSRFGVSLGWNFGRKSSLELRVERHERKASTADSDYEENRAVLTFRYVPLRRT